MNRSVDADAKFYPKGWNEQRSARKNFSVTGSKSLDIKHLAIAVIATGRASDVRWHFAAAFGAILEDGCTPALCATAHFLTAFGLAALWNGHGLASC